MRLVTNQLSIHTVVTAMNVMAANATLPNHRLSAKRA
jgi:hypothetical protein